jgi:probable rRNA maturation factor
VPPTSEPTGSATILIDGLGEFGLEASAPAVEAAARAALAAQSLGSPEEAEISITFLADAAIAALNAEWLDREGPTDVISFGLGSAPLVADIYVSVETARRNAARFRVEPHEELLRLVVHGVLHAAGYDHPEDDGRSSSEMFDLQERVIDLLLGGRSET